MITIKQSEENSVKKLIFTYENAIAESVLYKYPTYTDRTVICCSTQSGCPVGCRFCGAGDAFVRNLSKDEIIEQVNTCLNETKTDPKEMHRLQIMFMSMGEPMLNRNALEPTLIELYSMYPNAALLISSVGPKVDYAWLNELSIHIPTIGLQFSIHESTNEKRDMLIPFKKKMTLEEIRDAGEAWWKATGRKPFFNYCAGPENSTEEDGWRLAKLFDPSIWNCTISVICERNDGMPTRNEFQRNLATDFASTMIDIGFDVRVFDPAGQDDVGGGCGQLWAVQKWMKENPDKIKTSIGNGLPKVHAPKV